METGGLGRRHVLVLMCFAAAFVCYIDRVNISIAIIPMAEHFGWSQTQKGFVMSSFFIGYMLGQIPFGWLANRIGGRWVLGAALIVWSIFTAFTPIAALAGMTALVLARIVMGMGEAATFPATYNLYAKWIPRAERSRAVAFTLGGIPLGTVLGLALSGYLVAQFGWESVFYTFGAVGVVLAVFWYAVVRDSPAQHPGVSETEHKIIATGIDMKNEARTPLPVAKLVRSTAFWALVINHFCSNWILYVLLSWLPSYFRDVQHFTIAKAGLAASAPWLSMFAMANISAWVADRMVGNGVSVSLLRKIMQCIGLLGSSAFLLLTLGADSPTEAILLICGALGALGFTWAGYAPNHLEIAPRHADILMGITNTAATIPGIVGVAVSGWLLDTTGSYVSVFVLAAGITSIGALAWILFQRSTPIYD